MKRALPYFFHIGTQRAGSTYLYNLLANHPEISLSLQQEVNFYTKHFAQGVDWYLDSFCGEGNRIDTSPKYFMLGGQAAPRIKDMVTHTEPLFLLILRNPIDYVHSHYQMHLRRGYFAKHGEKYPQVPKIFSDFVKVYPDYLERGCYWKLLSTFWLPHFRRTQFKVILFEDFISRLNETLEEICTFFGVGIHKLHTVESSKNRTLRFPFLYRLQNLVVRHRGLKAYLKRSKIFNALYDRFLCASNAGVSLEERSVLQTFYQSDVETLEAELGVDISPWLDFVSSCGRKRTSG